VHMEAGPEQLLAWIKRGNYSQRTAAEYLGWDQTYVSQVINRKRTPELKNLLHLEQMTGIPIESWAPHVLDRRSTDELSRSSK
jgi:transcriptional regulator with XRE-family HTH domain